MSDSNSLTRRVFIAGAAATAAGLVMPAMSQQTTTPVKPPPLPADLVKQFVIAAHVDLDKTKEMLGNEPRLLNATWDWGGGDFEMAIGGSGHMGRRDIALFLLSQGNRMDMFVAAMLGELEVVKATLSAHPNLLSSHGPHGIPLIAHAKAGGDRAKEVLAYLESMRSK